VHCYFQISSEEMVPHARDQYDFRQPRRFTPQFAELYWAREKLSAWIPRVLNCPSWLLSLCTNLCATKIGQ
jgi:hypothetical protein